jgi:hypothetical protein
MLRGCPVIPACHTHMIQYFRLTEIQQSKQITHAVPKASTTYKTELTSHEWIINSLQKRLTNRLLILCYGSLIAVLELKPYS